MTNTQQQKNNAIAEFRYSIIAELTNPYLHHGETIRLMKEKARRTYEIPFSSKDRISEATIKKWLLAFRKYGKQGLYPKERSDAGSCKTLTAVEADKLKDYLLKHPQVSATAAYKLLHDDGTITSRISSSTLSRFIQMSGLTRQQRWKEVRDEQHRKFEFFAPLECVQADFLHAFQIPDGRGRMKKALLIAFVDDASRRIVYADFSFSEHSLAFEKGIKRILQTHGRIGRLYVDNGSTFVSSETRRICDSINVPIIHSRPRKPAGRGKIERFFRTVRDKFLRPLEPQSITSLAQLNSLFRSWLEVEYNRSPHRGLQGETPLDRWLSKAQHIIPTDPALDLDILFMHRATRRVYKDATFTLDGIMYEAPQNMVGEKITVMFDPFKEIRRLRIFMDGVDHGLAQAVDSYANTKIRRSSSTKQLEAVDSLDAPIQNESGSSIQTSLAAADISINGEQT